MLLCHFYNDVQHVFTKRTNLTLTYLIVAEVWFATTQLVIHIDSENA